MVSDRMTENTKRHVTALDFRVYVLATSLEKADYDVTIMDCAPSADVLHVSALVASDFLLVPTRLDPLSAHGVGQVLAMMKTVQSRGHKLRFFGVLPTFYERRTKETYEQLKSLAQRFGELVWPPIPQDTKAREAPAYGKTLWEYAAGSSAIRGYEYSDPRNP